MISLKKRFVLTGEDIQKRNFSTNFTPIVIQSPSEIDDLVLPEELKKKFYKRIRNNNTILFCFLSNKNIIAFYWGINAFDKVLWHDKFPIKRGNALLFDAYVYPTYRKMGLYKNLIFLAHDYYKKKGITSIFTIVEQRNENSLKANLGSGLKKFSLNYLIKVFRRNVFSIYIGKISGVYYVFRNEKSNSF